MIQGYRNYGRKNQLTKRSLVDCTCDKCQTKFEINYQAFKSRKSNRAYDGRDLCMKCWRFNVQHHPEFSKNMSDSIRSMIKTDPTWCVRNSQSKLGKINLGDKNGMKNPDVSKRMGKTRSKRFKNDPQFKEMVANYTRNAWASGKYEGVKVGYCEWFDLLKNDGTTIKCQGTWELAYARYLDKNNIKFEAHKGRIPYIDSEGTERSYYPDFFLNDTNEYIDVKSEYVEFLQPRKIEFIRKSNPELKLRIVRKEEMKELGILV